MSIKVRSYYLDAHKLVGDKNIKDLMAYAKSHQETGGFLKSMLEGDLYGAVVYADINNQERLFEITRYIINTLPSESYGSKEKVKSWLKKQA